MMPHNLAAWSLAIVVLAAGTAACGGSKPPAVTANAPGADAAAASDDSAAAGSASSAAADGANTVPGPISCVANPAVCSEVTLGGKDAATARERCKAAGGEPRDGECSRNDVIATCVLESKKATLYYYRDKDPEATKGVMLGGKNSCKTAGGAFTVADKTPTKKK